MSIRGNMSVRGLLYLLIGSAIVPAFALLAYSVYHQYRSDEQASATAAFDLAQLASDNVQGFLLDTKQVLSTIAARPDVRDSLERHCAPIFRDFKDLYPQFSNLSLSSPDGHIVCSTTAQTAPTFVGDAQWFKQVFEKKTFSIGPPYLGPVTKRQVVVLAQPVRNEFGEMVGSVQMPIDLARFRVIPGADKLPESTVITVFNMEGVLIARSRDAEQFVGKSFRGTPSVELFLRQRQGTGKAITSQGIERVFGFLPIPGTSWFAVAGIATEVALKDARQAAVLSLVGGMLILVLVLTLSVYLGKRIAGPIYSVREVARRVAQGDVDARAQLAGPLEIKEVAGQFNKMLDAIRASQEQLQLAQADLVLLGTCVTNLTDMVVIMDARNFESDWPCIIYVNEAFEKTSGYKRSEVEGRSTKLLHGAETQIEAIHAISNGFNGNEPFHAELLNYGKNGSEVWVELDTIPIRDSHGNLSHWVSVERDVTARKLADVHIHQLAYFDVLTNLPNRQMLMDRIETALVKARRDGLLGAALFIDLDNFKGVNDARGHAVGDNLLKLVAQRLASVVRREDAVARLGGDEFVILMTGLSREEGMVAHSAMVVAEKVREALQIEFFIDNQSYVCSACIGVAILRNQEQTPQDLLREADTAMYKAKSVGRNRVAFFEPVMQTEVEIKLALENDLISAVSRRELIIYAQPQIGREGQVVGAELLLRWRHPFRGFISPTQFIPIAEETGLIVEIGTWVLEQACEALVKIQQAGMSLTLSINVSPKQFRQPGFVDQVRNSLARTGASASLLMLEVTEGLLIENLDETVLRMQELVQLGVRFSIDDFGTGYSSLAYLKRLPLYELKIDKSFVLETPRDSGAVAIVKLILTMATHLGLKVVAEGVETREQMDFLLENNCDLLQGYFFARPTPMQEWLPSLTEQLP